MSYHDISASELLDFMVREDPVLLDMRDPPSFVHSHIPGARRLTDDAIRSLKGSKHPLVIYCYHGISSRDMASLLVRAGFPRVYNLEGGWQAWEHQRSAPAKPPSSVLADWYASNGFAEASPFACNCAGLTPLMQAALSANADIANELLACENIMELVNGDGNTALWFACKSDSTEIIRTLIQRGANIDHTNREGVTCLIYAASAGKLDVVKTLLECGASLELETLDGFTALDSAASLSVLKLLRAHARLNNTAQQA